MGSDSKYVAFGDDSQIDTSLAYAFVIVPRANIAEVEYRISKLKERFNIPQDALLHCRVLFHKHPKEKAGLSHLSDSDARSIIEKVINIINKNEIILRYASADLSFFQNIFTPDFTMVQTSDGTSQKFPAKAEPKGVLSMLMQACCTELPPEIKGPKMKECEIIASEDSTKIEFLGHGRKRADGHYNNFFSDIGAPEGMVYQLQSKILKPLNAPLLQLADIGAYICSHAFRDQTKDIFFKNELLRIKLRIRHQIES